MRRMLNNFEMRIFRRDVRHIDIYIHIYQPLGTRSICRRSRKYVFGYIAMYNFSAVYFLYFLQALFVSDFTSRTPNKDEQVKQLTYCRFV